MLEVASSFCTTRPCLRPSAVTKALVIFTSSVPSRQERSVDPYRPARAGHRKWRVSVPLAVTSSHLNLTGSPITLCHYLDEHGPLLNKVIAAPRSEQTVLSGCHPRQFLRPKKHPVTCGSVQQMGCLRTDNKNDNFHKMFP